MPSRDEARSIAIDITEKSLAAYGSSLDKAWLAVYEALLWYESVSEGVRLPHIIDVNYLRPTGKRKGSEWVSRSSKVHNYLAEEMGISPEEVSYRVDRLMKHEKFTGMQRQNSLGIAFVGIIKYLMEKFGDRSLTHEMEVNAKVLFPNQPLYGRTSNPRIDLVSKRSDKIVSISSFKWSIRHDRLNDITGECETYKKACSQLNVGMKFYSITNEFSPSRLQKLIEHPCIDGVVHIHKKAVVEVCQLNGRLDNLIDLTDFITSSFCW